MPSGGEHSRTKVRGRILPFLHGRRSFLGNRPPWRGRQCHRHPRDAAYTKGSSKVCQVGHSNTPVLTCGSHRGNPQLTTVPRPKRRALQLIQTTSISPPSKSLKVPLPPKSPPPARTLALVRLPTPPRGFTGVVTCLRTPELVEVDQEMPVGTMSIGMVSSPSLLSVSSSQVVKDDTTGLVYLDTVMTSIGRMVLGSSEPSEGSAIEDIADQS